MKRTLLFSGIAVLITLAILFTGCPQPSDTVTTINSGSSATLVKLGDPVVRVTAYEGFNVVSWEPVPDADSYSVWRTDTESSSQVLLTSSPFPASLSIVDNVTNSGVEKLANGRTYKYIVVATPSSSGRLTTVGSAQEDIYSGKGEATVTANIPDPTDYTVPRAADIKYRLNPDGTLYVSWTQPANATATVGYFPGGYPADAAYPIDSSFSNGAFSDLSGTFLFSETDAGYLYPRNAASATFPVIGGKATIAIQTAYWTGSSPGATMYAQDKPATQEITLDQYDLDLQWASTTPGLTANYVYQTATTGKVLLSWPRVKGDEDVYSDTPYTTRTTYRVWKRATALNQDSLGKVSNDWSEVTYTSIDPADGHTNNIINAVEDVGVITGEWEYIVYASAARGDKTSHSYPLVTSSPLTRTVSPASISNVGVDGNNNVKVSGTTNTPSNPYTAEIDVNGLEPGVTYTLYRGELTPIGAPPVSPSGGYQFIAYEIAPILSWTGQLVISEESAAIYDKTIVPRKSYRYKLVSSLNGTPLGDGSINELTPTRTIDLASVYSSLSLIVSPGGSGDAHGWITASVSNNGYTTADMEVKLFYRRTNTANPAAPAVIEWIPYSTSFERYTWTVDNGFTTTTHEEFRSLVFPVPNPVYGEDYEFKAVAYRDGKEMPNLDSSTYSSASVIDATDTSRLSAATLTLPIPAGGPLTALGSHTINGINGSFLNGAKIDLRVVRSNPGPEPKYYDQKQGTFSREPSPSSFYKLSFTLEGLTANQSNYPPGPDSYTLYWKYPWEMWGDTAEANRVLRDILF